MMLDLESVRVFVLVAEFRNFTRAAEAAGTGQPVVSQRARALEKHVGRTLIERTPRRVRLTDAGVDFLNHARRLLEVHDAAMTPNDAPGSPLAIGVSDHALGTSFHLVLARLRATLPPSARLTFRLSMSNEIHSLFEAGDVDLAIVRREVNVQDGEVLGEDDLDWYAAPDWVRWAGELPLALLEPPCGARAVAVAALDRSSIKWREAFVAGSCLAVTAAVRAGLGVAPLGRLAGADLTPLSSRQDLPVLPKSRIVMFARASNEFRATAARAVAASVREILGGRTRHR